jgi:HD domain-containing protein
MRSWAYAEWLGQRRGGKHDREVLYVATVLHDLGLTELAPVRERFEIEGADSAKEFLARHGMAESRIELVWDAIALHTTAGIPLRKSPEVALCHLGISHDLRGMCDDLTREGVTQAALATYPVLGLRKDLLRTLVRLYEKNPAAAASHAVSDACERAVPGFHRFNLCDVLLAAD